MKFRIGTRASALARAQAETVRAALAARSPELQPELVFIETSGDRLSSEPGAAPHRGPGGTKGLFVKEIEAALLAGDIDAAVHSCKDMPAEMPAGLALGATPERADPRDALVFRDAGLRLESLPVGSRYGGASPRRTLQLGALRGDLTASPMRGNVDTRLRKLREGVCDFLVLAAAGLDRLGFSREWEIERLDPQRMVPAPGQGILAVQVREGDRRAAEAVSAIEHARTRREADIERAFLRAAGGGCDVPLGALARVEASESSLLVFFSDAGGRRPVRHHLRASGPEELLRRGEELARLLGGGHA